MTRRPALYSLNMFIQVRSSVFCIISQVTLEIPCFLVDSCNMSLHGTCLTCRIITYVTLDIPCLLVDSFNMPLQNTCSTCGILTLVTLETLYFLMDSFNMPFQITSLTCRVLFTLVTFESLHFLMDSTNMSLQVTCLTCHIFAQVSLESLFHDIISHLVDFLVVQVASWLSKHKLDEMFCFPISQLLCAMLTYEVIWTNLMITLHQEELFDAELWIQFPFLFMVAWGRFRRKCFEIELTLGS